MKPPTTTRSSPNIYVRVVPPFGEDLVRIRNQKHKTLQYEFRLSYYVSTILKNPHIKCNDFYLRLNDFFNFPKEEKPFKE